MTTNGTASDNELYKKSQRMTTNDNELQRMTTIDNEWLFQLISLFPNKIGPYHQTLKRELFEPWGGPWKGTIELRAEKSP